MIMGRVKGDEVGEGGGDQIVHGLISPRREWSFILKTIGQFHAGEWPDPISVSR